MHLSLRFEGESTEPGPGLALAIDATGSCLAPQHEYLAPAKYAARDRVATKS